MLKYETLEREILWKTSVLWWWWALRRILYMIKTTQQVEQNFESLMAEISSLRKDMDTKVRPKNK